MSKKWRNKKTEKRRIPFEFEAPGAREAVLVGDFNSWDMTKHKMKRNDKGRWTKVVILTPGHYEYKFLVDGQWENDPNNEQMVSNSFGTLNNIMHA